MRILLLVSMFLLASCVNKDSLKKALKENPDILVEAIKENPNEILEALNDAAREAQKSQREQQAQREKDRLEKEFENPLKPKIDESRAFLGKSSAPVTIVEYSDFECPYCSKGYDTVKTLKEKYGDKIRVLYKHLPLSFHPKAMPAAKFFEAIAMQDKAKAYKFHDEVFENQEKLRSGGEKWMESVAKKKLGMDMKKLKKDIESEKVKEIIDADIKEASSFGITGTPGFIINGVSLRGAYPPSAFEEIIDRHLKN